MKGISYHPAAEEELIEAVGFAEVNFSRETGLLLDTRIDERIRSIRSHPLRYPIWEKTPARRCVVTKFPYVIFYLDRPDSVRILAIAHTSRRPGYWKSRITVD